MGSQRNVIVVREPKSAAAIAVDGARMATRDTVFDEFSAAFRFPSYFGRNWDAFEECVSDFLADSAETPVSVLISHASWLLADAPDQDFVTLLDILTSAGEPGQARLLVSLTDTESGITRIQERLRRSGLPFTTES